MSRSKIQSISIKILFTELSSSTINEPHEPVVNIFEVPDSRTKMPYVRFYTNEYGNRIKVHAGMPNQLASLGGFILGVVINGRIYPVWNYKKEQVLVRLNNGQHVRMSEEWLERYQRYYVHPLRQPELHNFFPH